MVILFQKNCKYCVTFFTKLFTKKKLKKKGISVIQEHGRLCSFFFSFAASDQTVEEIEEEPCKERERHAVEVSKIMYFLKFKK